MLRAIIIDDDHRDKEVLAMMINKYCTPEISVIGSAENVDQAYKLILETGPDLVFLDVELGNETGFDLLLKFTDYPFRIIFFTAHDKYAIRAIKFSALDYLLKPIDISELVKAVQKTGLNEKNFDGAIKNLLKTLSQPRNKTNQIAIPTLSGFQLLPVEEIIYCEANKEYTFIHCVSQPSICSSINLGEYEDLLEDYFFSRVHHSFIVNRHHVRQYIKGEGGELILTNNKKVPVSRRRKQEVIGWLTNHK
jgi:two-component system LytT family response regulator